MPTPFTPWSAVAGGALIGLAACLLLLWIGRVAGVSGIANGLFARRADGRAWRLAFLIGLPLGAAAWFALAPAAGWSVPALRSGHPTALLIAGGLLVGAGTRWGSGCTSGHGICGLARGARRSFVAVAIFMVSAMATVAVLRHGGGWLP